MSCEVSRTAVDAVVASLRAAPGRETCGFVVEDVHGRQRFVAVTNISTRPGAFSIHAVDLERVQERARREGCAVIALVHTHRDGVELSADDEVELSRSGYPWCVVSDGPRGVEWAVHTCAPTAATRAVARD
jgi:proteasome lid subunit RPN8/RPN11